MEVNNYEIPYSTLHYEHKDFESQAEDSVSPNPRSVTYQGTSYTDIMMSGLGSYNYDYGYCYDRCQGMWILVNDFK